MSLKSDCGMRALVTGKYLGLLLLKAVNWFDSLDNYCLSSDEELKFLRSRQSIWEFPLQRREHSWAHER